MPITLSSLLDTTLAFEKTADVESGPQLYYTDNYLVQFEECHFLMDSLREKSGNNAVQLTSMLIQNAIGVPHQWFGGHH